jgi:RNA recognition motif-containing protein
MKSGREQAAPQGAGGRSSGSSGRSSGTGESSRSGGSGRGPSGSDGPYGSYQSRQRQLGVGNAYHVITSPMTTVYIGNMHYSITEGDLIKLCQPFGEIQHVTYLWHQSGPQIGLPRGFAFVEYSKKEEVELVCSKLNGKLVYGKELVVRRAETSDTSSVKPVSNKELVSDSSTLSSSATEVAAVDAACAPVLTDKEVVIGKRSREASNSANMNRPHALSSGQHAQKKQMRDIDDKMKMIREALSR